MRPTAEFIKHPATEPQLLALLAFKAIVMDQLPSINREIIARTIFDRAHQSMLVKLEPEDEGDGDSIVIGGLCFYEIEVCRCVSLVYFAIDGGYQGKGYGTLLMDSFKYDMRKRDQHIIVTAADIYSLNFYFKNGFIEVERKDSTIERQPTEQEMKQQENKNKKQREMIMKYKKFEPWMNYIEEYYSSVLVAFRTPLHIRTKRTRELIRLQKQGIINDVDGKKYRRYRFRRAQMEKILQDHRKKYEEKHGPIFTPQRTQILQKQLQSQQKALTASHALASKLQQLTLLRILKQQPGVWLLNTEFHCLEDDYSSSLADLVTLHYIEDKVARNGYRTSSELCAELARLFENLKLFLPNGSHYYRVCCEIQKDMKEYMTAICEGTLGMMEQPGVQKENQEQGMKPVSQER